MLQLPVEAYNIALSMVTGMHRSNAARLLSHIGDVRRFFDMTPTQLHAFAGLPRQVIDDSKRQQLLKDAYAELDFINQHKIKPLWFDDKKYPVRLNECDDAPSMLYCLGDCNLDSAHVVAIVGTRRPSAYGLHFVDKFVHELAERIDNLVIVSGLAYGIDVAAHKASLDAKVPTVAVQATPLNTIYPADHRDVARHIISKGGALVTEYHTRSVMHRGNFLARNRIIASLSDATIVIESDERGGAMATARMASAYNRPVCAVPGRVSDITSRGTNKLIANNVAQLITSADSFIEIMGWQQKPEQGAQQTLALTLTDTQQRIVDMLRQHPEYTVNELVRNLSMPYPQLCDQLFQLEMSDVIVAVPGGHYAVV